MLNVLGMTSWRTPLGFDRRFRKLYFGMEKDPPDVRRLLFASWVMFVSIERLSAGVRRVTLDMAIWNSTILLHLRTVYIPHWMVYLLYLTA